MLFRSLGRAHWSRGYATEAAAAVLDVGFGSLHLSRVIASIGPTNERAAKLLRRLGFRLEPNGQIDPALGTGVPGLIGFLDATGWRATSR